MKKLQIKGYRNGNVYISGLEASKALYSSLESRISHLKDMDCSWLAAVLVGNNPASEIYVKNKTKKFESLGLKTDVFD